MTATGVWAHSDFCVISSRTGGVVMLGRRYLDSDFFKCTNNISVYREYMQLVVFDCLMTEYQITAGHWSFSDQLWMMSEHFSPLIHMEYIIMSYQSSTVTNQNWFLILPSKRSTLQLAMSPLWPLCTVDLFILSLLRVNTIMKHTVAGTLILCK